MIKEAIEIYHTYGVDVLDAIEKLKNIELSIHCWQGDDVVGFMNASSISAGIQATGNYPYKATTPEMLMMDFEKAISLIPGKKRINLHAIYAITKHRKLEELSLEDFRPWVEFAKKHNLGIDMNPTLFAHPLANDGFTLSNSNKEIQSFWIKHVRNTRDIANKIAVELDDTVLHNIWIPDGFKESPVDRLSPRKRLKDALDQIYEIEYPKDQLIDAVESKVFGIGIESYTVGSHEFYMNYAKGKNICCLLDNGHFHPTEQIADKISSMALFFDHIALHLTRPVRWDSDHVPLFDDVIKDIAIEIVRVGPQKFRIGLDYFDASINRVAAWVIGARNVYKSLLYALLMPHEKLEQLQLNRDHTQLLMLTEELKTLPFGIIWDHFCEISNVPNGKKWFEEIMDYEEKILSKRG